MKTLKRKKLASMLLAASLFATAITTSLPVWAEEAKEESASSQIESSGEDASVLSGNESEIDMEESPIPDESSVSGEAQSESESASESEVSSSDESIAGEEAEASTEDSQSSEVAEESSDSGELSSSNKPANDTLIAVTDEKPSVPEQLPEYDGTQNIVFHFNKGSGQYQINSISRISVTDESGSGFGTGNGCNVEDLVTENPDGSITTIDPSSLDYVYDLNECTITLINNSLLQRTVHSANDPYSLGSLSVSLIDESGNTDTLEFSFKAMFLKNEVTLPQDNTALSSEEMQTLAAINETKNIIIKTPNGVSFRYYIGGLKLTDGKTSYDFGTELITDFSQISDNIIKEEDFAFRIAFNDSDEFLRNAYIGIPLGSQQARKNLSLHDSGTYKYYYNPMYTVDENGVYSVSGLTGGSYIAITKPFEYHFELDNGKATISRYNGSDSDIVIPSTLYGNSVTEISRRTFFQNENAVSISIPNSVTQIDGEVFAGCSNLAKITLPDSVVSIGYGAFQGCKSLKTIALPSGITAIEDYTFIASGLESIIIPNGVSTINSGAFAYCENLTSVTIPQSVVEIGKTGTDATQRDVFLDSDNVVIRCYENSAAYEYAKEMEIKFELISEEIDPTPTPTATPAPTPAPITGKDDKTNIGFSAPEGVVPAGTTISVSPVTSGNNFMLADTALKELAEKFTLFDINLMNGGVDINPQNGKVTVSIPVPQGYESGSCKIYRIEADGSKTDMNAFIKDGYLVFETDHFSLYAVAQMKAEPTPTPTIAPTTNPTTPPSNSPQTGDSSNVLPFALVALCSAAGFIFLMVRKKAK